MKSNNLHLAKKLVKGLTITTIATPILATGVLVATTASRHEETGSLEVLKSLPRAARLIHFGIWATTNYKAAAALQYTMATPEDYKATLDKIHDEGSKKLLHVFEQNGGIYVKAGQLAVALRSAPPQYIKRLETLVDKVPSRPFDSVCQMVCKELEIDSIWDVFSEFEPTAAAAASLAQVHKAKTKDGNCVVAVKVQHLGLESAVAADLAIMSTIVSIGSFLFPTSDWRWLVVQLKSNLERELDFTKEAQNAQQMARRFHHRRHEVYIPDVYTNLSTKKVLTMQWATGDDSHNSDDVAAVKISDVDLIRSKLNMDTREVGRLLFDVFAEQMFNHGVVHGDPHPGNILVTVRRKNRSASSSNSSCCSSSRGDNDITEPRSNHCIATFLRRLGACSIHFSSYLLSYLPYFHKYNCNQPQLILLDHGLHIHISDTTRRNYCLLWSAFILGDMKLAHSAAAQIGGDRGGRVLAELLRPRDWSTLMMRSSGGDSGGKEGGRDAPSPPTHKNNHHHQEQRKRQVEEFKTKSGITSIEDAFQVLGEVDTDLLDSMRSGGVVRVEASKLGAGIQDRLVINGRHALAGVGGGGDGGVEEVGWWWKMKVRVKLEVLGLMLMLAPQAWRF
jgi:predicted unusual protein kinase regulating ubiquinone biosynthesis (AarF/ABC1/UbiB family)